MSWALRSHSDSPASSWGSSWGLPLSTLALDGSRTVPSRGRAGTALGYADLGLLVLALPAFVIAGWPLLGYAVAAAAWLAGRGIEYAAKRRVTRSLAGGDRRTAVGTMAVATLGRVWLITLSVLVVGLAEREAGLAAAILSLALFTLYMVCKVVDRLLYPEESQG
jgi:hypothetical protein